MILDYYNEPPRYWRVRIVSNDCTTLPDWYEPSPYWTTSVSNWAALPALPPKNWRWFGVFRQAIDRPLREAQTNLAPALRRLEFLSLVVRRRQKRRRFIHTLKATK